MVFNYIILSICILLLVLLYSDKIENLVNLDEERKKTLKKCCEEEKCYEKPPFLHGNCEQNKAVAAAQIKPQYQKIFTTDKYNQLVDDIDTSAYDDMVDDLEEGGEPIDYQDVIIPTIPVDINEQVITDVSDVLPGYDATNNYTQL